MNELELALLYIAALLAVEVLADIFTAPVSHWSNDDE